MDRLKMVRKSSFKSMDWTCNIKISYEMPLNKLFFIHNKECKTVYQITKKPFHNHPQFLTKSMQTRSCHNSFNLPTIPPTFLKKWGKRPWPQKNVKKESRLEQFKLINRKSLRCWLKSAMRKWHLKNRQLQPNWKQSIF